MLKLLYFCNCTKLSDMQTDRHAVLMYCIDDVVTGASRDLTHLSTDDSSMSDSVLGIVRICSGLSYETFKTRLITHHCARIGYSDCRNHSQSAFMCSCLQYVCLVMLECALCPHKIWTQNKLP